MNYFDFIKYEWKAFKRSPSFHKKLAGKIFLAFGYLVFLLYMIGLPFLAYYGIHEAQPRKDAFIEFHSYLFMFFFFIIYIRMLIPFTKFDPYKYLLLPIPKSKMITYHLLRHFFSIANLMLVLSVFVYAGILIFNNYSFIGVLSWSFVLILTIYIISFLLFFTEKNQLISAFLGFSFFFILIKIKLLVAFFEPFGKQFYVFYEKPFFMIIPFLFLLGILFFLYRYLNANFYIDKFSPSKQTKKIKPVNFFGINIKGTLGAIIKKDIKMIFRNERPRQFLYSFFMIYFFAVMIYGGFIPDKVLPNTTYGIFLAFYLSGFFIMGFGSFIPAWDSTSYNLLMSQNINYKEYLNAKWMLMIISVLVAVLLSLPMLFFGIQVFLMIVAMAIFNIGVNIPLVLFTGLLNTTPVKLNERVKAFKNNQSFNFKVMLLGFARIAIPIIIYYNVKKYFGEIYAVWTFVLMGILGLLFKNYLLNRLTIMYKKNKYKTIHSFAKTEQ